MLSFQRGVNNPACKSKEIQDYYGVSQERCDNNDIYLFNKVDLYNNKMSEEKFTTLQSIKNSLISFRDIERIICYDLNTTNENEHMMVIYHTNFLLKEDQPTYLDFVRKLKENEMDELQIREIKKSMIIKIYMDIKINTSVALFSLKQYK